MTSPATSGRPVRAFTARLSRPARPEGSPPRRARAAGPRRRRRVAMASLGMPKTTHVASSCAIVCAPARLISSSPSAPSSPMPVRITPTALAPAASATERNSTSTLGRWRETSGPSLTSTRVVRRRARGARVAVARRDRARGPSSTRSPLLGLLDLDPAESVRGAAANAAVKTSGMCWTITMPGRVGRHRLEELAQRLGAAGGRADGDDLVRRDARAARAAAGAAPRRR